jgi:hypothetical protein
VLAPSGLQGGADPRREGVVRTLAPVGGP